MSSGLRGASTCQRDRRHEHRPHEGTILNGRLSEATFGADDLIKFEDFARTWAKEKLLRSYEKGLRHNK